MRELIKKGIDAYLDWQSFKTETPLVLIESDDWGSLRTKDKKTRDKLNAICPKIQEDPYNQLDSIATKEDLEVLFEVLHSVRDAKGNPACLTANVCTANPDFKAIKSSGYEQFFYTPFTKNLEEYSKATSLFKIWQKGIVEKVFKPQLHGREHVHAMAWLAELRAGNKDLIKAFELESWGIPYKAKLNQRRANLQASLDTYTLDNERQYHQNWIEDSVNLFKQIFGYQPNSFIPPAYTWHSNLNSFLSNAGIKTLQGIKLQYQPNHNSKTQYKKIPHFIGQVDKVSNIIYTNRNAFFEPFSVDNNTSQKDLLKHTMLSVDKVIRTKKPVIIGSHRINYIGRLDENHRDKNLKTLQQILKQIVERYPNVEFIDSGELAKRITL